MNIYIEMSGKHLRCNLEYTYSCTHIHIHIDAYTQM
jgi:hypothetical protein